MRSPIGAVSVSCSMFPVFLVAAGSKSSTWTSSSAAVRCSTPRGTMTNSPSASDTMRSRNSTRNVPRTTRKSSSSRSWWCHTNSPLNLTSFTSCPFSSPTTLGRQYSPICDSFAARFTLYMLVTILLGADSSDGLPQSGGRKWYRMQNHWGAGSLVEVYRGADSDLGDFRRVHVVIVHGVHRSERVVASGTRGPEPVVFKYLPQRIAPENAMTIRD